MSGKYIQERREALGMSQRKFALQNDINYRTLQDYEQGRKPVESIKGDVLLRISRGLGCSIEDILLEDNSKLKREEVYNRLDNYYAGLKELHLYGKYYRFPVIVNNEYVDMSRVHPLKQKVIARLGEKLSDDINIATIMLFGSSITMQCNLQSDIDLAVRLKDSEASTDIKNSVSEKIQDICEWKADIIWYDRISKSDRIYHDICKGVQIV